MGREAPLKDFRDSIRPGFRGLNVMARTLYAALVGIDAYQPPVPPLRGCANDIDAIALLLEVFSKTSGFIPELKVLKDSDATRANVIDAFRAHLARAGADDIALFYYSGHGSQERAPPEFWHIEPDHLNETLVCYDSRDENSWDLADKELAVLIAEVAARKPHLVCVLDCCHSGSGTRASLEEGVAIRRAPTDQRPRPLESFLDGALTASPRQEKASSDTNWLVMPTGRHVLLAACRSSETAKEVNENGRPHGAFTAALIATLQQSRGAISYRDLLKRAEAQVRLRVAQQVPQIEASVQADLLQPFLGGAVELAHGTFTLSFDRGLGWIIDGGAIHGIAAPQGTETTSFAVFPLAAKPADWQSLDAAVGLAEVQEVRPELSCVRVKPTAGDLDSNLTYRAIVAATPLPPKQVYFVGEATTLQSLRQVFGNATAPGNASLMVRETATEETADFRIMASPTSYRISRASAERPLIAEIEGTGEPAARLVLSRLEHVARWQAVAALRNDCTRLGNSPVVLTMYLPITAGRGTMWEEVDARSETRLSYTRGADGKWTKPRFRLTLTNSSDVDLYCALLWLGESYSIASLFPAGALLLPKQSEIVANDGKAFYAAVPDEMWNAGRTELTDHIKLIVSREQFDPSLFNQGAIDTHARTRDARGLVRPRSILERLANRVHTRDVSTEPDDGELLSDWTTSDLSLTVVRPREAAQAPPEGATTELGAGVTLIGHPAFKAQASLVSVTGVGRALGALGTPAIFRDDPALSQPFLFETARGSDPGLGALQLTDIQNAEKVTPAAPLRLRVAANLEPDEHVIPYAWDGEFYLPLGGGRLVGGNVEIELRQIPIFSTVEDVERGIISSIRIMFQKITSPYLPIEFDYPHLAAVGFDAEGNPTYDKTVAVVREKVANASRILLYVHGILGDTRGMSAAATADIAIPGSHAASIADRYDLLLAFDYENINTSIKATARDLKQRLAMVGLGADHSKTLHVVAHSMGGLVSRWFIEQESGNQVVQHLVTLGTPHAGSPWPTIENWATAALAIGLNGLSQVGWPLKLLGDLAGAIEKVDVALDEMAPGSPFLNDLAQGTDPKVPYTLLVGNTSIIPVAIANGRLDALLAKLAPQRVLHDFTSLAFLNKPNDIAVAVSSAQAVPQQRAPAPTITEVTCDHITFFTTEAGRKALLAALQGA
ncbi:caspase family protein [Bradyrhizobium japonicum]|uniref:caspase family protein n=1 Tax=Bradyrhizobium japonicum TaxID=375 RepID=UPI0028A205FB|nr:caspase family protein [Bradyrhizobium japonicum]